MMFMIISFTNLRRLQILLNKSAIKAEGKPSSDVIRRPRKVWIPFVLGFRF